MHVVRRYRYRSRSKTISEGAKVRNVIASGGTPCRPDNGFRDIEISCFKGIQPPSSRTTAYTVSFAISSFDEKERRLFLTYSHIQYRLDLWLMAYRAYVGGLVGSVRYSTRNSFLRCIDMVFVDVSALLEISIITTVIKDERVRIRFFFFLRIESIVY